MTTSSPSLSPQEVQGTHLSGATFPFHVLISQKTTQVLDSFQPNPYLTDISHLIHIDTSQIPPFRSALFRKCMGNNPFIPHASSPREKLSLLIQNYRKLSDILSTPITHDSLIPINSMRSRINKDWPLFLQKFQEACPNIDPTSAQYQSRLDVFLRTEDFNTSDWEIGFSIRFVRELAVFKEVLTKILTDHNFESLTQDRFKENRKKQTERYREIEKTKKLQNDQRLTPSIRRCEMIIALTPSEIRNMTYEELQESQEFLGNIKFIKDRPGIYWRLGGQFHGEHSLDARKVLEKIRIFSKEITFRKQCSLFQGILSKDISEFETFDDSTLLLTLRTINYSQTEVKTFFSKQQPTLVQYKSAIKVILKRRGILENPTLEIL